MIKAVDLFAGAGGLSLGLEQAGFDVIGAVEIDQYAGKTYRMNFPNTPVYTKPIEKLSTTWLRQHFKGVDLICGGPPCQGFSVAGPSQYGIVDPRNDLMLEIARVVKATSPSVVLLENVKGILQGKLGCGNKAIDKYFNILCDLDYVTKVYKLQAADFGVPQLRERVFLISIKGGKEVKFPSLKGSFGTDKKPWRNVKEAIGDLPILNQGEVYEHLGPYVISASNNFQKQMRIGSKGVANHEAMKHSQRVLDRIKVIPQNGSMKDVPEEHGQRQRNTHILDGKNKRYKMNYSRVALVSPSIAITANFQTIHVHPVQDRMLTAREGARIQTFPDAFIFEGPRTLPSKKLLEREGRGHQIGLSQYNQIGNAVPPILAKAIAAEIKRVVYD